MMFDLALGRRFEQEPLYAWLAQRAGEEPMQAHENSMRAPSCAFVDHPNVLGRMSDSRRVCGDAMPQEKPEVIEHVWNN
jgi:hypothetical protein